MSKNIKFMMSFCVPLLLFMLISQGQDSVWTLKELTAHVLNQNLDLQAAEARLKAAQATARQIQRWTNPDLHVNVLNTEREWKLSQEIDLWRIRSTELSLADATTEIKRKQKKRIERNLLDALITHYWNLAELQNLEVLQADEDESWSQILMIRQQELELGVLSQKDYLQQVEEAARYKNEQLKTKLNVATARAAMNTLLGRNPDMPLTVDASAPAIVHYSIEDLLSRALLIDPDAQEARASVTAAGYKISLEQKSWRPLLSVGPSIKEDRGEVATGFNIGFSIPIWDSNRGAILAAKSDNDEALSLLQSAELKALQTAYHAFMVWTFSFQASEHYETTVQHRAEKHFLKTQHAFDCGDLGKRELLEERIKWLRRHQQFAILRASLAESSSLVELISQSSETSSLRVQ